MKNLGAQRKVSNGILGKEMLQSKKNETTFEKHSQISNKWNSKMSFKRFTNRCCISWTSPTDVENYKDDNKVYKYTQQLKRDW